MTMHFPLRPVLRLRRSQERNERLKLEAVSSQVARARMLLDELTKRSHEWSRQIQDSLGASAPGSQLQWDSFHGANLIAARASQAGRLLGLEKQRRTQLRLYLQARQQRELIETLFRRAIETYRLEQLRREQQRLDDLFLTRRTKFHDDE
jgi:flagellar export protein FliJ